MHTWCICVETHFEASHYLPDYPGECSKMHGHRWEVKIEVKTNLLDVGVRDDIIIDFHVLKSIPEMLDHMSLNDRFTCPSAENIAEWIFDKVQRACSRVAAASFVKVTLWESPECSVEIGGFVHETVPAV